MVVYSSHALKRMFQRSLTTASVEQTLSAGQMISSYSQDTTYPSRLNLGFESQQPVYVVAADTQSDETVVLTAYVPDASIWRNSFTRKLT
jgi:Domain of unknown function (DUF4258)